MTKGKQPTPQELYKARKQKEEDEKTAYLPPGLINHGNTCFMNSVLQGLIATPLLFSLVHFHPVHASLQNATSTPPIAANRSPQLTNGHGHGGEYERDRVEGMALGDLFVKFMDRAWDAQMERTRGSITPKDLLLAIGRKYDQYLDFRQQDAHEFLRHLLDAMRMEELDIIKKRQPPPPKKKRRRGERSKSKSPVVSDGPPTQQPSPSPQTLLQSPPVNTDIDEPKPPNGSAPPPSGGPPQAPPKPHDSAPSSAPALASFPDMLFGGLLASFLVCEKCKHVSITYEDFNDLSLSIRAEDYGKERKRDKLRGLVGRLRLRSGEREEGKKERASSVPASPVRVGVGVKEEGQREEGGGSSGENKRERRRSVDSSPVTVGPRSGVAGVGDEEGAVEVEDNVIVLDDDGEEVKDEVEEEKEREGEHVEFTEPEKPEKEKEKAGKDKDKGGVGKKHRDTGENWARLGRRISVSMGLTRGSGESGRGRERRSLSRERERTTSRGFESGAVPVPVPKERNSGSEDPRPMSPALAGFLDLVSPSRATSPSPPIIQRVSSSGATGKRRKSPRPPKLGKKEEAYLRALLADVRVKGGGGGGAGGGVGHFGAMFTKPGHHHHHNSGGLLSAQSMWDKTGGQIPSVEECLRLFTAVEALDGENRVGCRNCWKVANGLIKTAGKGKGDGEEESGESGESEEGDDSEEVKPGPASVEGTLSEPVVGQSPASSIASLSAPSSSNHDDAGSTVSAPTSVAPSTNGVKLKAPSSQPIASPSLSPSPEPHPLTSYGGLPVPSISTTEVEAESTSDLGAGGSLSQLDSTTRPQSPRSPLFSSRPQSPSMDSLRAPNPRYGRPRNGGNESESSVGSEDESSEGEETDASESAYSDSPGPPRSTTSDTSKKGGESRNSISDPQQPASSSSSTTKVPRSKQVIMRRAYKRYLVAVPPPVLVIHLKRFQQISKNPMMSSFSSGFKKLDDYVSFPEYLDLAPFLAPKKEDFGLSEGKEKGKGASGRYHHFNGIGHHHHHKEGSSCMYRLYAIVVHIGNMLGGHYVAYTALPNSRLSRTGSKDSSSQEPANSSSESAGGENKSDRQWAYISDTIVRLTTLEEVLKAKAYLCMYERV